MIEWAAHLQTNVSAIDTQHKDLINYINDLLAMGAKAASKEEIEKSLLFLGNYVVKHFSDEEKLQAAIRYPKYEQHCSLHREFIETYKEFLADYKAGGISPDRFMSQINKAVIHWVVHHIQSADADIAQYIKAHNIQVAENIA
jgi:hemerythrin